MPQPSPSGAVRLALIVLLPTLALATLLFLVDPAIAPAIVDERLDLTINTLATLVAMAVALLAWGRFREVGELPGLFRGSAFLVLAALNAMTVGVMLLGFDEAFGMSLRNPGQLPVLGAVLARAVSAALLLLAGMAEVSRWRVPRLPTLLVLTMPALLVIAAVIVGAIVQPSLPMLMGQAQIEQLQRDPSQPLAVGGETLLLALPQVVIGLGFAFAAWLSYVSYQREGRVQDGYLAIGLVLAAFSQAQAAIHPGTYSSLVTIGDILRVAFYIVLLLGVVAERRADLRALRRAHLDLQRLREAELAQATYEERARLAREIHDGLAQDLWYAKLKQARLASMDPLPSEARGLATEVADAIDSALAEARQAVMALRPTEGGTFAEVLQRYAEDFGDRFGLRVDCAIPTDVAASTPRAQAELLRIVQEALNNVRKHADATLVRVEAESNDAGLRVRVSDNGRGFDPSAVNDRGYGLRSMQERAKMVGATLRIDARPQDGTRIEVTLPRTNPA